MWTVGVLDESVEALFSNLAFELNMNSLPPPVPLGMYLPKLHNFFGSDRLLVSYWIL